MKKVVRVGTLPTRNGRVSVFCEIRYDGRLSISGVVGPRKSGDAYGGCGQIDMEFAHRDPADDDGRYEPVQPSEFAFAPGWDAERWLDFLDVWKKWHLNDMRAGCEHQRELGWERDGYDAHPSEPCPECGYEFGTAWKRVEVPAEALDFLAALPETDRTYPWAS